MQQTQSPEVKALSILYLALLIGQVLFALISLFIVYSKGFSPAPSDANLFIFLCVTFGIAGYLGGSLLFRKKLEKVNGNMKSIAEKFNDYRAACVNRWALMEFAVIFCIIIFFKTSYPVIMIFGGAFILLFLTLRPSIQKIAAHLGVSEIEIRQMNTENSSME